VERTPNTSHTLVQTLDLLRLPLQLLAARVAQQQGLLQNLVGLHVAHADRFLLSADVLALENGVAAGSGRDCDFDLRVGAGEVFEVGLEEVAGRVLLEGVGDTRQETKHTSFPYCYQPSRSSGSRCACIGE
jgi:hypothetical protein